MAQVRARVPIVPYMDMLKICPHMYMVPIGASARMLIDHQGILSPIFSLFAIVLHGRYASDGTGMVDYALGLTGAAIVEHMTSETFEPTVG